jgi:membrane-associated phospholipid phosphatase
MLLIGSVLYLLVIFGVMLARGISIEPQWVVLALLLIAVAMGRGGQFIKDWTPFLVLFFAYEAMRGFAGQTGLAPNDLSGAERLLFGGSLPTLILQQHFYDPNSVRPQDVVALVLYFMHFPLPIVVGFIFWTRSREHYWRFISALLLMSFIAFLTYLVYPSTPPRLQFPHEVHHVTNETVVKLFGDDYFVSPIYSHLNPNQYAAFPSLHAAFPLIAAVYAWNRYRLVSVALAIWTAAVWVAIVYLGEHYFVDALAGLVYAAAAAAIVELVAGRFRGRFRLPRPA